MLLAVCGLQWLLLGAQLAHASCSPRLQCQPVVEGGRRAGPPAKARAGSYPSVLSLPTPFVSKIRLSEETHQQLGSLPAAKEASVLHLPPRAPCGVWGDPSWHGCLRAGWGAAIGPEPTEELVLESPSSVGFRLSPLGSLAAGGRSLPVAGGGADTCSP